MRSFDLAGHSVLFFGFESAADSEHVPIGMAKVHFADVPRHISRRKCDFQSGGNAMFVHLVHVVYPDRHPDAFVALLVSVVLKSGGVGAAATASLSALTEEDANFLARSNCGERGRRSPVPQFLPPPPSQTTRPCWRCRTRLISELDLWLP